MTWNIQTGDVLDVLRAVPDESVHCVVTSPPYWGLRDYGVDGQIGLEESIDAWVARLVEVFEEVRRVLRGDGTCWVNVGDSYYSSPSGFAGTEGNPFGNGGDGTKGSRALGRLPRPLHETLKPKDLIGQPWRLAFALQAAGWWLRKEIIWNKPNPMPEAVTDRPTKSHEQLFLLSKSARYFYDGDAIREPLSGGTNSRGSKRSPPIERAGVCHAGWAASMSRDGEIMDRNARSVWTIPTESFPDAHFATFPTELARRCISAGTSQHGVCPRCGAPWARVVEEVAVPEADRKERARRWGAGGKGGYDGKARKDYDSARAQTPGDVKARILAKAGLRRETTGWTPSCACRSLDAGGPMPFVELESRHAPISAVVLDPFSGAGTTVMVARRLGRRGVGIELNPEYAEMSRRRIKSDMPLFNA